MRTGANLSFLQSGPRRATIRAFTLLEVMIGMLVMMTLVFSLYQFVRTNLVVVQASTKLSLDRAAFSGLVNLVQAELNDLPGPNGGAQAGVLLGTASKTHDMNMDSMQWLCHAGQGLLTTSGDSEYFVTLAIQPHEDKKIPGYEIGLRRRLTESQEGDYKWYPLISSAAAMEIRYFDTRLGAGSWLERWSDQNFRPTLVRIRLWKTPDEAPFVAILSVPAGIEQNAGAGS